jgi:hypothetical protein
MVLKKPGGCADKLRSSLLRLAHEGPSSHIAEICELSNVRAYRFVPEDVKYRVAMSAGRHKRYLRVSYQRRMAGSSPAGRAR